MKKSKYIISLSYLFFLLLLAACEYEEPFPDPSADFTIWGTNPETNVFEELPVPYTLTAGINYTFIVEGTGQQFVFWFDVEGDPESNLPTGSKFSDRGLNHLSTGTVVPSSGRLPNSYRNAGVYEIVLVASSYRYSNDSYKESLTTKQVTVVAAK